MTRVFVHEGGTHVTVSTIGAQGIRGPEGEVPSVRRIDTGTGLTGGGSLAADRELDVVFGDAEGTVTEGDDPRLSDTRTPTDGSVTDAKITAGGLAPSSVTGTAVITTDPRLSDTRTPSPGSVTTGTIADAAVTDAKLAGGITPAKVAGTAVVQARAITAGTGLTGGGTLAADRALAADFGTGAGKVTQGNDPRLSDTRTPTDGSVTAAKITAGGLPPSSVTGTAVITTDPRLSDTRTPKTHAASHAAGGSDAVTPADIGAPYAGVLVGSEAVTLSRAQPVWVNTGGGVTVTLPDAATHVGVQFTVVNAGTDWVVISRGAGTVNGIALSPTLPGRGQVHVISDGVTWRVLDGRWTTIPADVPVVGKATHEWDHGGSGTQAKGWWRAVDYDSGWRDIAVWSDTAASGQPLGADWVPVPGTTGRLRVRRNLLVAETLLAFVARTGTGGTPGTLLTVPPEFSPTQAYRLAPQTNGERADMRIQANGSIERASNGIIAPTAIIYHANATYLVNRTLPTALPGI